MNNIINLEKTTFIIPLKVEHEDRYRNARTVLGFLNHHFKTNVIIYEIIDGDDSKLDFLWEFENLKITHGIDRDQKNFHRTRFLNTMLDEVNTPVVVNYDIDVLLVPENYLECQNDILSGESDVIYPYEFGIGQYMVQPSLDLSEFYKNGYNLEEIPEDYKVKFGSEYGHCIFFNTDVYRNLGGENEDFISYGPEDKERGERFKRLGAKVKWKPGYFVYHFEHYRGDDSSPKNPNFDHNWAVYNNLNKMCETDFSEYEKYYSNPPYAENYKRIGRK